MTTDHSGKRELPSAEDFEVVSLGTPTYPSPLLARPGIEFADGENRILAYNTMAALAPYLEAGLALPSFDPAGARRDIFFDPATTRAGIVTCGGLCPGLNDVIRGLVLTLHYAYDIRDVLGFRYGYSGLGKTPHAPPLALSPDSVSEIHHFGGTLLGSCRGTPPDAEIVDTLVREKIDLLFSIGGDGTLRGAHAISREIERRGLDIAVVAIPKTIDNDLAWVDRSFGFTTSVQEARRCIEGVHEEARGVWNGVGVVKLMGRDSGFIAAYATLANQDVNFCLIPEVPFALVGENGFLAALDRRLAEKHHAVVVVAEGAGQNILPVHDSACDASGNPKLGDIGPFLCSAIVDHFSERDHPVVPKYIDPSYLIRSLPAGGFDSGYCYALAQYAVHAAMAGKTGLFVGRNDNKYVHVPLPLGAGTRTQINPASYVWQRVLGATGQPDSMM
ncbi:MAG: ATP-dependent 6-phosphofructokinase [Verrucomicrobiales bacterium]